MGWSGRSAFSLPPVPTSHPSPALPIADLPDLRIQGPQDGGRSQLPASARKGVLSCTLTGEAAGLHEVICPNTHSWRAVGPPARSPSMASFISSLSKLLPSPCPETRCGGARRGLWRQTPTQGLRSHVLHSLTDDLVSDCASPCLFLLCETRGESPSVSRDQEHSAR